MEPVGIFKSTAHELNQLSNHRPKVFLRFFRRKGISNKELFLAGCFWMLVPGATAMLSAYFAYRLTPTS